MARVLWTICITTVNGFIYIRTHKLKKATVCSEPQVFFSVSCFALGLLNQSESLWWQFLCLALVLGCLTDGLLVSCVLLGN